jgi:hypothetical protein
MTDGSASPFGAYEFRRQIESGRDEAFPASPPKCERLHAWVTAENQVAGDANARSI